MNASARTITAALAVTLPAHTLLILGSGIAALVLLIYIGIALPAIWSVKPARRKAASAVLRQILNACTPGNCRWVSVSPDVQRGEYVRGGVADQVDPTA